MQKRQARKLTDEAYINFYKNDANDYCWVSRENNASAVTVLPLLKKDGKEYVLLICEYRIAVDKWLYQLPAGLVDAGETPAEAAVREVKEETGAVVTELTETARGYTSAGLTDEFAYIYEARVESLGKASLQGGEQIRLQPVKVSALEDFLLTHRDDFCLRSAQALRAFLSLRISDQTRID